MKFCTLLGWWLVVLGAAEAGGPASRQTAGKPDGQIRFQPLVICDDFPRAYQVAVADVNGDRRPDIVVLGEDPGTVEWFENPGTTQRWARHPISRTATRRNIDLAVHDVDGDGRLDVVLASEFDMSRSDTGGVVTWHRRGPDLEQEWAMVRIHAEPTAHRVRWADADGDGRKELITVPIVGSGARRPEYGHPPVRILCHRVPADPVRAPWPEQVVSQALTLVHGACVVDWEGDGREELLTASSQGIHLFRAGGEGGTMRWSGRRLAAGHRGEPPNSGSSEVCVGRGAEGVRFLAAIEPWHGNEVVVYTPDRSGGNEATEWRRDVIDDSFKAGHALACADLDADGVDEIIAGYRGEGASLYGYKRLGERWERFAIDLGGMAAQGCVAADVNGDGRPDLVAAGGTTHNVKLYVNQSAGPWRPERAPGKVRAAAGGGFIIQAHRGAGRLAPENTLPSFELAWRLGVVPEADVGASRDGVLVAFHDNTFERLVKDVPAELRGRGVRDLTWDQLKALDVGAYKGDSFRGQRIARLSDAFAAMRGRPERRLYLDVKDVALERLAECVRASEVADQVILASTRDDDVRVWKELLPESHTLLWMGGTQEQLTARLDRLRAAGFPGVTQLQIHVRVDTRSTGDPLSPSSGFLRDVGRELRGRGILFQVLPWECSDPAVYRRLLELGAASFATDEPLIALEAVRTYESRPGTDTAPGGGHE